MASHPNHPNSAPEEIDDETRRIINERLDTLERDKRDAKPWPEVKERILKQLKQPKPA
jgi:flagellar motility protein MotE (MotC chaperone)